MYPLPFTLGRWVDRRGLWEVGRVAAAVLLPDLFVVIDCVVIERPVIVQVIYCVSVVPIEIPIRDVLIVVRRVLGADDPATGDVAGTVMLAIQPPAVYVTRQLNDAVVGMTCIFVLERSRWWMRKPAPVFGTVVVVYKP